MRALLVAVFLVFLLLGVGVVGAQETPTSTVTPPSTPTSTVTATRTPWGFLPSGGPCPVRGYGTPVPQPGDVSWRYAAECGHCLVTPTPGGMILPAVTLEHVELVEPTAAPVPEWRVGCPGDYSYYVEAGTSGYARIPLYGLSYNQVVGLAFELRHGEHTVVRQAGGDISRPMLPILPLDNPRWLEVMPQGSYCVASDEYSSACSYVSADYEIWSGRALNMLEGDYVVVDVHYENTGVEDDFIWLGEVSLIGSTLEPCRGCERYAPSCVAEPTPTPVPSATPTGVAGICGPGLDWCYYFDFRDGQHGFYAPEGIYTPGVGFEGTNNWWNGSRAPINRVGVTYGFREYVQFSAGITVYRVGYGDDVTWWGGGGTTWALPGAWGGWTDGYNEISWIGSRSVTAGGNFGMAIDDKDTLVSGVKQRTKIHWLYVSGRGQSLWGPPYSGLPPSVTPTPTPTPTPTAWVTPVYTPTSVGQYCSVYDWFEADPAVEFDVPGAWIEEGQCYKLLPGVDFSIPSIPIILPGGFDAVFPEFGVCVDWVRFPGMAVFGFRLSIDWFLLPVVGWFLRRLFTM